MSKYFNDAPIITPEDDKFGIDPFAKAVAQSIIGINSPVGTTIAINGRWGSGKSSAINLIRHHLLEDIKNENLEIIDFKCWWFKGEEALTLAFLQELNGHLSKNLSNQAKDLLPKIGKKLLQAGPVLGHAVNLATCTPIGEGVASALGFFGKFFEEVDNMGNLFEKLSKSLVEQNKKYLVIIDDIDRLSAEEALLIFRLIKSVGRLPNVVYLVVFDRQLAEKALEDKYANEGPHFLEKIIQASFEVPLPRRDDLNSAMLYEIEKCCGEHIERFDQDVMLYFFNIYYDVIAPYINLPRDIARVSNAMAVSWPAVAGEVNVADFVALEVLRIFEPQIYSLLRNNKERVCGTSKSYGEDVEKDFEWLLDSVPVERQDQIKNGIIRLFPRFENVHYTPEFMQNWDSQRLLCVPKHFDTYFRLSLSDEALSMVKINEFLSNCNDIEYVKSKFVQAVSKIGKNGKSEVPLLLDELMAHSAKIDVVVFPNLISSIFEIADDIYRDNDKEKGFLEICNTHLRIHWLIRELTFKRCSLEERSKIFMDACREAQVGWLVDFTSSAVNDYFPRDEGAPEVPEKCLIIKDVVEELKGMALRRINQIAQEGNLIDHFGLLGILFRWREFADDESRSVKEWTSQVLGDDISVAKLAKSLTGMNISTGLGFIGPPDRVSRRTPSAQVNGLDTIMDVDEFKRRLKEVAKSGALDDEQRENVRIFSESWERQESGKD